MFLLKKRERQTDRDTHRYSEVYKFPPTHHAHFLCLFKNRLVELCSSDLWAEFERSHLSISMGMLCLRSRWDLWEGRQGGTRGNKMLLGIKAPFHSTHQSPITGKEGKEKQRRKEEGREREKERKKKEKRTGPSYPESRNNKRSHHLKDRIRSPEREQRLEME